METIESLKKENAALKLENQQLNATNEPERFQTVFEYSRLAIKIVSADFKILQANLALVKLLGFNAKEEIIGTHILDYSPRDHHAHWKLLHEHLWQGIIPFFCLETSLIKKDGTIIWCEVTSILFPDKAGSLGYTTIEDVTEQRQLRLHKEEFISVVSHELKTPITSLKANLQLMSRMLKSDVMSVCYGDVDHLIPGQTDQAIS